MMAAKDTDELVAKHPELTPAGQAELRRVAAATFEAGKAKLFAAEARAYAERLSVADMDTLVRRNTDPIAERHRAALPAAMGAMGGG